MAEVTYYAMIEELRVGPMSLEELLNCDITRDTPVWKTGMTKWVKASAMPELADVVFATPPDYNPGEEIAGETVEIEDDNNDTPPEWIGRTAEFTPPCQSAEIPPAEKPAKCPEDYLPWSILATMICCVPLGLVGVFYATKVEPRYMAGDYAGAKDASKKARLWSIIAAGSVVVILLFSLICFILSAIFD